MKFSYKFNSKISLFCVIAISLFAQNASAIQTFEELSALISSNSFHLSNEEKIKDFVLKNQFFNSAKEESALRFRSFLLNQNISLGDRIEGLRAWVSIESLIRIQEAVRIQNLKVSKKVVKNKVQDARTRFSNFILAIKNEQDSLRILDLFAGTTADPIPTSERNKMLYELFHAEYKKVPKGTYRTVLEIFSRHPLSVGMNCLFALGACVLGTSGGDIAALIKADAIFSAGFLFLESNLGPGVDLKMARYNRLEWGTFASMNQVKRLNESSGPAINGNFIMDSSLSYEKKMMFDVNEFYKSINSSIEEADRIQKALTISDRPNIGKLEDEVKLLGNRKKDILSKSEAIRNFANQISLEAIYLNERYQSFVRIDQEIQKSSSSEGILIFKKINELLNDGFINFNEAQVLNQRLVEKHPDLLPKKLSIAELQKGAKLGENAWLEYYARLLNEAQKAQQRLQKDYDQLELQTNKAIEIIASAHSKATSTLAESKKLEANRIQEEEKLRVQAEQDRANKAAAEQLQQKLASEKKLAEEKAARLKDPKFVSVDNIESDLNRLTQQIRNSFAEAKFKQEHSRDGFGNARAWLPASQNEMHRSLAPMKVYISPLQEIKERIEAGARANPEKIDAYNGLIQQFNALLAEKSTISDSGGFARRPQNQTVSIFGAYASSAQSLHVDGVTLAIQSCATMMKELKIHRSKSGS